MKTFALPSIVAIAATYLLLRASQHHPLHGSIDAGRDSTALSRSGRVVGFGIAGSAIALLAASAFHRDLGLVTFIAAVLVFAVVLLFDRRALLPVVQEASWSILPLVAGLFVIVRALDTTGAVMEARRAMHELNALPPLMEP